MRVELTSQEKYIFEQTLKTGDLDIFTEHFFRLPYSGTWFTTEDRVEQYDALYDIWVELGRPDGEFGAVLDGKPAKLKILWDDYYGGYPMILLPHGFRSLSWVKKFVNPAITKGMAITGTGSGKTAGVAMAALTYCAIYPGFGFRNVAQKQVTSQLMLNEIVKWVTGSPFERFIVPVKGANNLWKERPYPTITIDIFGFRSTFTCQTLGRSEYGIDVAGSTVLGTGEDFICVEEAQLVTDINAVVPVLLTRLRGTRDDGKPRFTMLRWITNPGANPELRVLMDEYREMQESGDKSVILLDGLDSSVNLYVTRKQISEQQKGLDEMEQERWIGGKMHAVLINSDFGQDLLNECKDDELDAIVQAIAKKSDTLGITNYELPYEPGRSYIVVADVGKSFLTGLHSVNVPCVMVFDITDFLRRPTKLVAFHWFSGEGRYDLFSKEFMRAMSRYRCHGFYDATNVQTAFEDLDQTFAGMPTQPIFFSGAVGKKNWALAVLTVLLGDGQFALPYIKGLWHQAMIYELGGRKRADDLIATLMVFALALQFQGDLWDLFVRMYDWEEMRDEKQDEDEVAKPIDPFARVIA